MTIDAELTALGKTAPRVTIEEIEANIASEHYFTAADGLVGAGLAACFSDESAPPPTEEVIAPLRLLTFCVLVLKNGFTVTGESACASPENFDADIGRKVARGAAIGKCWPLLGFRLRDRLVAEAQPSDFRDRVRQEASELQDKVDKLQAFLGSAAYAGLGVPDRYRLAAQHESMADYLTILQERIAAFELA